MGPIERQLRARLLAGATEQDAVKGLGALGGVVLARYQRRCMLDRGEDGRLYLKTRATPAAHPVRPRHDPEAAQRAREQAEGAERRRLEQDALRDRLRAAKTPEARAALIAETKRIADREAEEARALAIMDHVHYAPEPTDGLAALFGIEFDTAA